MRLLGKELMYIVTQLRELNIIPVSKIVFYSIVKQRDAYGINLIQLIHKSILLILIN